MEEGTPRTKAMSVHKGDREQLDCLKGGIDFSRYFPQIASGSVSSRGHLQVGERKSNRSGVLKSEALT